MKVTDCGCFGDFLKLEPKISFFKDVFLLFPAVYFLFKWREMHQLFSDKARSVTLIASTVLLFVYSISNFIWDIPHIDFRPFNIGKDVATQRTAELDAMSNVQIKSWVLEHKSDGRTMEVPNAQYMKEFQSYKEVMIFDQETKTETEQIVKSISNIAPSDQRYVKYNWDVDYIDKYNSVIKPLAEKAKSAGVKVKAVMGGADENIVSSFREVTGLDIEYYKADDILLKTIVRSNPGIVLWKDGKIVFKWHYKKVPSFDTIVEQYMR